LIFKTGESPPAVSCDYGFRYALDVTVKSKILAIHHHPASHYYYYFLWTEVEEQQGKSMEKIHDTELHNLYSNLILLG
jgi:hypothetical protein